MVYLFLFFDFLGLFDVEYGLLLKSFDCVRDLVWSGLKKVERVYVVLYDFEFW